MAAERSRELEKEMDRASASPAETEGTPVKAEEFMNPETW
jgi:hypothetical protein